MDLADQIVGRNGDDGKGSNRFPTMRMTPVLSKPGDSEGRAILHGNGIGLLCSGSFDGSPLKEAFNGDDAAPLRVGRAEGRQLCNAFGSGIDRFAPASGVLAPMTDQPPTQQV